VFACARKHLGSRHVGSGKTILQAVLNFADAGKEMQVGRKLMTVCQRAKALGTVSE
jgi:hypothetical protein